MRQLLQNVSTGEITVDDVPAPAQGGADVLVATRCSVISPGTERAVLELGQASLIQKARARPDLVRKVVESAREEGIGTTIAKVRGRLGQPNALGYSSCGMVLETCEGSPAAPGELVACAGAGRASHAEVVAVPRNLVARVPAGVPAEDAAYATIAAIALHGVRIAEAGLGDMAVVVGLGVVGQLALDLLEAAGCVPLGVDPDDRRVELAKTGGHFATTDEAALEAEARRLTGGRGADAALVTAASSSSAPLATAARVARERAVVSIVGDVKVESPRAPLFAKELRLVVSRSYGPGRYDPVYEERGVDYPAGYVRWTEGRNLEEVLRLMAAGRLRPSRLTTHEFDLEDGAEAYRLLESDEHSVGIILRYPARDAAGPTSVELRPRGRAGRRATGKQVRIGLIGAGSFARSVLLPELRRHAALTAVASRTGVSAKAAAADLGAQLATTDAAELIASDDVDAVVIATRHDSHASLAIAALEAGKHVFVEKPLALDRDELGRVETVAREAPGVLFVGFNRRFAPLAATLRDALGGRGPLAVSYRVNAGRLPRDHWTHDPDVGGGRIVGEVCHFVDFVSFLAGGQPREVQAAAVGGGSEPREDNVAATLTFADGSIGQILYTAFGDAGIPKERIDVLGERGAAVLTDFSELSLHVDGRPKTTRGKRDKGHAAEIARFVSACAEGEQPWPVEEMVAVMEATFAIRDAVHGV